jgi:hypothetical protein
MPASAIFPSLLLAAATLAALAAPAPARADELAGLINAYRAAPGHLRGARRRARAGAGWPPGIVAVRVGSGTFLEPALRKFGYRADRAEAILLRGPEDARAAMDGCARNTAASCSTPASRRSARQGTAMNGRWSWPIRS